MKLIIIVSFFFIYTIEALEAPCPQSVSLPLEKAEHQKILYEDYYNDRETVLSCVCELTRPCIRKCCEMHQVLTDTIDPQCISRVNNKTTPDLLPNDNQLASEELKNISGMSQHFKIIHNRFCPNGTFRLEPERYKEDNFMLFANGSLFALQQWLPQWRYCMDWLEDVSVIAVLLCHIPEPEEIVAETAIYPFGFAISIPFLLATLVVYSIIPELRNLYGITLMCYVACLIAAYGFLAGGQLIYHGQSLCIVVAFVIHFSFLASFFWLNVMCFDIWWTFGGFRSLQGSIKQREMKKFVIYSVYAWGCAAFFTGICLVMDLVPGIPDTLIKPGFGHSNCWFSTNTARAIYFYAPMAVTIVCNISLFISTTMKILQHKKDTAHHLKGMDSHRHDDSRQWFNLYLKLFIVMGISWSMEIISWLCQGTPQYVWYVTDLANTLQGVIIFIIFVWKPKIKRLLLKRFKRDGPGFGFRASTKSAGYSSTTSRTYTSALMPLQDIKITNHNFDKNLSTTAVVTDESECL